MSNKDIARGLSLMVIFSSLLALKFNLSTVLNWAAYSNLAGQIQVATTLSYWITVVGATLLVMDRRSGYWLLVAGTVLAIVGQGFGYIPFVPWFRWNPLAGLVVMHMTNLSVIALIGYHYFKKLQVDVAA